MSAGSGSRSIVLFHAAHLTAKRRVDVKGTTVKRPSPLSPLLRPTSQPRNRQSPVNIDDRAGGVRHVASHKRRNRAADILRLTPASLWHEAFRDAAIVDIADARVMSVAMMPGRTS